MKRSIILFLAASLLLICHSNTQAQGKFGAFIGVGTMFYQGDLQESPWPNPATMRWTVDAGVLWQIDKRWGLHLNYTVGRIVGDDKYAVSKSKRMRDLKFKSFVHDISIRGTYDILRNDRWRTLPYITAGVGAFRFEPKRDGAALRPMATEGVAYSNWTVGIPTGIGLKHQFNCKWALKAEAIYHWTLSDRLDDVSGAYPDAENEVAFYSDPGGVSPPRDMRGDPTRKDGVWDINIGVIYYFTGCKNKMGGMIEDCKKLNEGVDMDMMREMYK